MVSLLWSEAGNEQGGDPGDHHRGDGRYVCVYGHIFGEYEGKTQIFDGNDPF